VAKLQLLEEGRSRGEGEEDTDDST
ncbi:uncharacterized protein METZ01_LOCUS321259, partial [marine metagenome]